MSETEIQLEGLVPIMLVALLVGAFLAALTVFSIFDSHRYESCLRWVPDVEVCGNP